MNRHNRHGFTIVELIVVIVVIAVLAAITIVSFNGVQQRARNTAKITAVQAISKMITLYRTEYGVYPLQGNSLRRCFTLDNKCTMWNGTVLTDDNSVITNAIGQYGTVPASAGDNTNGTFYGITYMYDDNYHLDGVSNKYLVTFWLEGTNQDCTGIGGMVSVRDTGTQDYFTPGVRSKGDTGTNQTRCYLMYQN